MDSLRDLFSVEIITEKNDYVFFMKSNNAMKLLNDWKQITDLSETSISLKSDIDTVFSIDYKDISRVRISDRVPMETDLKWVFLSSNDKSSLSEKMALLNELATMLQQKDLDVNVFYHLNEIGLAKYSEHYGMCNIVSSGLNVSIVHREGVYFNTNGLSLWLDLSDVKLVEFKLKGEPITFSYTEKPQITGYGLFTYIKKVLTVYV